MTLPGEFKQAVVQYITDEGLIITVSQKAQIAEIVQNPIVEKRGTVQGVPERGRLRTITIATVYGTAYWKREIVICDVNNPLWRGTQNFVFINGVQWNVIERRGEYRRGPRHF